MLRLEAFKIFLKKKRTKISSSFNKLVIGEPEILTSLNFLDCSFLAGSKFSSL